MDSTVNHVTQNFAKIIATTTTTKTQSSNMLSNQNICNQISNKRNTFKRTTATATATAAILLYISYCLNIYLLWTNVVMYTESVQNTQHPNHSNLMDSFWRIKSNTNTNTYRNHNSKLNLNSNESSSNHRQIQQFSELSNANASSIRNNQIDFDAQLTAYFNSKNATFNSSALKKLTTKTESTATATTSRMKRTTTAHSILSHASLKWSSLHLSTADGNSFIGKSGYIAFVSATVAASASTPLKSRPNKAKKFRSNQRQQPISHRYTRATGKSLSINVLHKTGPIEPFVATHFNGQNEFRDFGRYERDENEFTKYHTNENVIKSAENDAIKMNVNNFTPKILETNNSNRLRIDKLRLLPNMSGVEMENQRVIMQNDSIITELSSSSSSSSSLSSSTAMTLSFDHKNDNRTETIFDSELIGNMTSLDHRTSDAMTQLDLGNQPVTGDSERNNSNKTIINRMENKRNYNKRMATTTATQKMTNGFNDSPKTTRTKMPTLVAGMTENSISSGSMLGRFGVNDVFEIERKQKYFSNNNSIASINGPVKVNNNSHEDNRIASDANDSNRTKIISLLGLFELSTRNKLRPEGQTELAAAKMAVDHINKRGLLPGYTLQLITNDTKCDPGIGVDRLFHALYTQYRTRILMLLGSACSEVTESLAKVVPYWNILQVSFGSTSPALSDRSEFPLFYRTVAPDSSHNPARIAFIRRFGWDTVTTFSQNEEIHSLAVNDLVTELENANISCAATITFAETDFKNQLKMLRDLDTRIIIGSFSHELAPKIFCEAYKLGMYGADYVWILHEIVGIPWWHRNINDSECNRKQLQEVAENLLMVSSYNSILSDEISHSGLTYSMFIDELNSMVKMPQTLSRYAAQTYDAVWSMALVLREADTKWKNDSTSHLRLDRFDYTRYDMALEFLHQFSRLNFSGISGPVSFSGADRVGISVFNQVQNGHLKSVALFHPSRLHLDFDCPKCVPIKWKSGQVPIAKRFFKLRVATIAPVAFFVVSTLALIGIIISIAFLAFNLHFRNCKAIKLSSPKLSNITAFGCILVYAAVILLGLDYSTLPANEKAFPIVCTARVYLLSSGFSLAFGSMFAKTYRVHRIFTRSGSSVCKDKMLQDTQLISLVCALLVLDGLVVTLWVLADPMERHLNNLTLEISSTDRSVVYQPQIEVCRSQHTQTWLGALYIYKGLLLVVGVYMAWETRHVKIPALNDSQYIGVSVYSVVITSAIVVVLANLIAERVTLAFITITALILTSTTATLCLLFLPKMHDIWGKGVVNDPVINSMGLKMECNTRRFMVDDKRELQYRVEVQNRVYKKQLATLDIEISKLEKMLETPSTTSSSDLSIPRLIKHELAVVNEENEKSSKQRTPSIGDGLPLLLLSVLPPVIPRASWPSAAVSKNTMRKSVTFSSQPQLEDESSVARLPAIDLLHLRLTHQQATEQPRGFIDRIIGFFGNSKPSSRNASTSSIAGGPSGLAAAFKAHMGLFSNLVPMASSCNAIDTAGIQPLRRMSMARSGNAIDQRSSSLSSGILLRDRSRHFPLLPPFIIGHSNDLTNNDSINTQSSTQSNTQSTTPRKNLYVDIDHEPKVNFQLPFGRRPSIFQQQTLRERVKGSPRFPHRIAPYNSLNALVENAEASGDDNKSKWKSMEDTKIFYLTESSTFDANIG